MYANCIFCSAALGRNEALEHFPIGARLAFDAWKGRLWAVCPVCGRWNLSPVEERWETVEEAEKLFRDSRMKVQSENVGLAKLPDGTRLVRVGAAVPGEMAAWRYGTQLLRRRRRYIVGTGLTAAGGLAVYGGIAATGMGMGAAWMLSRWLSRRGQKKVIHRIDPADDPTGQGVLLRRWHVRRIHLQPADGGDAVDGGAVEVRVRDARSRRPRDVWTGDDATRDLVVTGTTAHTLLARAMVHVNRTGATTETLRAADRILETAGSAHRVLHEAAARRTTFSDKAAYYRRALDTPSALALEMALNEEAERRALEGELAALEAAWREAEEIAAIADSLPGEAAYNRLLDRLSR
jgi:hypothetical protein